MNINQATPHATASNSQESGLRFNLGSTPGSSSTHQNRVPRPRNRTPFTQATSRGPERYLLDHEQIRKLSTKFLREFKLESDQDGDDGHYMKEIFRVLDAELKTLDLDARHVLKFNAPLYKTLVMSPTYALEAMEIEIKHIIAERMAELGETFTAEKSSIKVRPMNLKEQKSMRDLDPTDIDQLVSIRGIVIRCSELMPEMTFATFRCANQDNAEHVRCNNAWAARATDGMVEEPQRCEKCGADHSFELSHNECYFKDKQLLKLQEAPESIPEGETPHTILLYVFDELFDSARPGDRVEITGFYRAVGVKAMPRARNLKSIFRTYIDVVNMKSVTAMDNRDQAAQLGGAMSHDDIIPPAIQELMVKFNHDAMEEQENGGEKLFTKLVRSFAPSIWEMDDVKRGLLCLLLGGANKKLEDGNSHKGIGRFRGEINVLMCGDPSTAKSQFLQYVHKMAPRGVYTSGKGSSAVGLTAYITKDPDTKEIVLESGALVLSDQGICCIDEFDKMDDSTRAILHEAMEQQTVSVAKAGIVCSLNARAAILASANPVGSRYDRQKSVVENINLPPTLLSRFDLIYLMLDKSDRRDDMRLAKHLTMMYTQNRSTARADTPLDGKTLKHYIALSRRKEAPSLSDAASARLIELYVDLRSQRGNSKKVVTATPRQLESMIRISEALARAEWAQEVTVGHVEEAHRLMKVSLFRTAINPETGEIDLNMFAAGKGGVSSERTKKIEEFIIQILGGQADRSMRVDSLRKAVNEKLIDAKMDVLLVGQGSRELEELMQSMELKEDIKRTNNGRSVRLEAREGAAGGEEDPVDM